MGATNLKFSNVGEFIGYFNELEIKDIHFSYSYDHTFTGEIQQYTYGTHEIGISFRLETLATQRHIGFWDY